MADLNERDTQVTEGTEVRPRRQSTETTNSRRGSSIERNKLSRQYSSIASHR